MILFLILALEDEERQLILDICRNYRKAIYRKVKQITGDDTVDDIVQDTIIRLIKKIDHYREVEPESRLSYVLTCAEWAACDSLRAKARREKFLKFGEEDDLSDELYSEERTFDPEKMLLQLEHREQIKCVLDRLPERYALVIRFKFMLNLSDEEIAKAMGIKAKSVATYVARARSKAREIRQKEAIFHE